MGANVSHSQAGVGCEFLYMNRINYLANSIAKYQQ